MSGSHHDHGFNTTANTLHLSFQRFDLALAVLTVLLTILSLVFNIIMCYVFWGLRKSANALIFLNLAVVDVLLALIVMPYSVMVLLTRSHKEPIGAPSMVFCAVSGFVFEMSVYCTVGFIFLASADRFLGVYHPIFHRKYLCRQNLIKLVLLVWIISPCCVFCYIIPWLFFISSWNVYTDLQVFTVCHGEYWWKHDHHPLANVPMYSGGAMLLVVIILIVVGNLAVLKQLLKKRQSPLANLQERKQSIAVGMGPPMFTRTPHNSKIESEMDRMSREEVEDKKSERIFETDSAGDITGINIKAIMRLYISSAARKSDKKSKRRSPSTVNNNKSEDELSGTPPPSYMDRTETPNLCESLLEEDEEEEEESSIMSEDEEDLISLDDLDLDGLDLDADIVCDFETLGLGELGIIKETGDVSLSPELGDMDFDLEGDDSPDQAVWKVIKFVAALKRNTEKKKDLALTSTSEVVNSEKNHHIEKFSRSSRKLYRSISDSEINFCIKEDEVEKEPSPKHRNYSVMNKTIPQPNGDAKKVNKKYSIIKDSLTKTSSNGFELKPASGYMTPLAENNQIELASLISIITKLKKKGRAARESVVLSSNYSVRISSPMMTSDEEMSSITIDDEYDEVSYQAFENSFSNSDNGNEELKTVPMPRSPLQKISLSTLGMVARFKNKLQATSRKSLVDEYEVKSEAYSEKGDEEEEEEEDSEEEDMLDLFKSDYQKLHDSSNYAAPTPPPIIHHKRSSSGTGRDNLFLNTITEEEPEPGLCEESIENMELRGYFIDDDEENEKDDIMPSTPSNNFLAVPSITSPRSSGTNSPSKNKGQGRVSRSKSLDNINPDPILQRTRRGAFSSDEEYLASPGPSITPSGRRPSQMQHCASNFKRRMRASSVYKISQRSSVNMQSMAQMVYNFNKHAEKKKKEVRAAKTVLILVFYYIITLVSFMISFYYLIASAVKDRQRLPYWITFYSYVIYLNAMFNPVIHFWRNQRVRTMATKLMCPRQGISRWPWRRQ